MFNSITRSHKIQNKDCFSQTMQSKMNRGCRHEWLHHIVNISRRWSFQAQDIKSLTAPLEINDALTVLCTQIGLQWYFNPGTNVQFELKFFCLQFIVFFQLFPASWRSCRCLQTQWTSWSEARAWKRRRLLCPCVAFSRLMSVDTEPGF